MLIKSEYENLKYYTSTPGSILEQLNHNFTTKYKNINTYFTCAVCDIHLTKNKLLFASAGHPDQFLVKSSSLVSMSYTGRIIGIKSDSKFSSLEYKFDAKDRLLLFTDGMYEQFNRNNQEYGFERFQEVVQREIIEKGGDVSSILDDLKSWVGDNSWNDDICYIYVERGGK